MIEFIDFISFLFMSAFPDQLTSDLASVCAFDFTDKFSLLSRA